MSEAEETRKRLAKKREQLMEYGETFVHALKTIEDLIKERDQWHEYFNTRSSLWREEKTRANKLEKERDQLKAELERYQWQPIRTAPRDGRELWGFGEGQQFVVNREDDLWCNVYGFNTTHWMPLPSPPVHTHDSGAMEGEG